MNDKIINGSSFLCLKAFTFVLSLHLPESHLLMTLQWESRLAEYPQADDGLKIKNKSITPSIYIQILLTDRSIHFHKKNC